MTDATPPRLTLRQRWHRLRTSPRFPFVLFFGLLIAGGLSQVYCYWWGVRIQRMVARHGGNTNTYPVYPYSFKQAVGARFIEPLEPINGVNLAPTSPVPASDIALLEGLRSLSGLGLQGTIDSDGWRQVGRLRNLRAINATGPNLVVRDRDLEQLARLPKLRYLLLGNLSLELRGLRHFARHATLTWLDIHYDSTLGKTEIADWSENSDTRQHVPTKVEAASFQELASNQTLKGLTLSSFPGFGDEQLLALTSALPDGAEPLPSLTKLHLSQTGVTGDGVRFLGNLPSLEDLNLTGIKLGDDGLRGLKHNSTIRVLNVYGTQIGDRDVETLLTMSNLQTVNVAHTSITEQALMRLTTHPTLQRLTVGTDVPYTTVIALRNHLACHVVK